MFYPSSFLIYAIVKWRVQLLTNARIILIVMVGGHSRVHYFWQFECNFECFWDQVFSSYRTGMVFKFVYHSNFEVPQGKHVHLLYCVHWTLSFFNGLTSHLPNEIFVAVVITRFLLKICTYWTCKNPVTVQTYKKALVIVLTLQTSGLVSLSH